MLWKGTNPLFSLLEFLPLMCWMHDFMLLPFIVELDIFEKICIRMVMDMWFFFFFLHPILWDCVNARPSIHPSIHSLVPMRPRDLSRGGGKISTIKVHKKLFVCTCVLYRIFPKYAHLNNLLTRVRKKDSYKEEEDWVDGDK
jgi:hypothetical protein